MSHTEIRHSYYPKATIPVVEGTSTLRDALLLMNDRELGFCIVEDHNGVVIGVFSDGDLRRKLVDMNINFTALMLTDMSDLCSAPFQFTESEDRIIEKFNDGFIGELPHLDADGRLLGLFRLLRIRGI